MFYIKPKQLEEISDAIYNGTPYSFPPVLKRIADLNPDYFGSQHDVFKSQVEVAKRLGLLDKQYDKETGKMTRQSLPMEDFMKHKETMAKKNEVHTDPILSSTTITSIYSEDDFDADFEAMSAAMNSES